MAVVATQGKRPRLGAQRRRPLGLELVVSLDEGLLACGHKYPASSRRDGARVSRRPVGMSTSIETTTGQ
jgi:hypothetical protein